MKFGRYYGRNIFRTGLRFIKKIYISPILGIRSLPSVFGSAFRCCRSDLSLARQERILEGFPTEDRCRLPLVPQRTDGSSDSSHVFFSAAPEGGSFLPASPILPGRKPAGFPLPPPGRTEEERSKFRIHKIDFSSDPRCENFYEQTGPERLKPVAGKSNLVLHSFSAGR